MTEISSSRTWQDRAALGIYVFVMGQFLHVTGGIFEKMLLGVYPVPQMTFIRSLLRLVLLAAMLLRQKEIKAVLSIQQPLYSFFRILTYIAYNYCMLYALSLASLTASCSLLYATPFFTLLLSALVLKEKIGKHKWIALTIASIGVSIAIRQNSGFEWVFIVILFGALIGSLNKILIRKLVATEHSLTIAISGNAALALVLVPFILMNWQVVSWYDLGLFTIAGFLTAIGQYATVQALRFAQASTLAPFDYTSIIWASLFDFFIWDVTPSSHFVLGVIIIVVSNLYLMKSIKWENSPSSAKL
jgi:drug/metabolite transporter (DMT)-like permease